MRMIQVNITISFFFNLKHSIRLMGEGRKSGNFKHAYPQLKPALENVAFL